MMQVVLTLTVVKFSIISIASFYEQKQNTFRVRGVVSRSRMKNNAPPFAGCVHGAVCSDVPDAAHLPRQDVHDGDVRGGGRAAHELLAVVWRLTVLFIQIRLHLHSPILESIYKEVVPEFFVSLGHERFVHLYFLVGVLFSCGTISGAWLELFHGTLYNSTHGVGFHYDKVEEV